MRWVFHNLYHLNAFFFYQQHFRIKLLPRLSDLCESDVAFVFLSDFVTAPTFICGIKYLLSANILPLEQNMSSEEGGNFLILQEITATFSWKYIVSVETRF